MPKNIKSLALENKELTLHIEDISDPLLAEGILDITGKVGGVRQCHVVDGQLTSIRFQLEPRISLEIERPPTGNSKEFKFFVKSGPQYIF